MSITAWDTFIRDGVEWTRIQGMMEFPIEYDPSKKLLIAAPSGLVASWPMFAKGDSGFSPTFDAPTFNALAPTDPTPDSLTLTLVSPETATTGPVYHLTVSLHKGAKGDDGDTILDPGDYGTPLAKYIPQVNSALTAFELVPQKVGSWYWPTTVGNLTDTGTLCSVPVAAQPFDWFPQVSGSCVVTGGAADVRVDLIARVNNATGGDEVGRAFGLSGVNPPPHVLASGPPTAAASTYGKVLAGAAAVIYLRAEKQGGTSAFTTTASTTRFKVKVDPIP